MGTTATATALKDFKYKQKHVFFNLRVLFSVNKISSTFQMTVAFKGIRTISIKLNSNTFSLSALRAQHCKPNIKQ